MQKKYTKEVLFATSKGEVTLQRLYKKEKYILVTWEMDRVINSEDISRTMIKNLLDGNDNIIGVLSTVEIVKNWMSFSEKDIEEISREVRKEIARCKKKPSSKILVRSS